ncbi:hypothetical protein ACFXP3_35785 [Streptomyces sp. NPDC059096]|uniref:hypothetical protein n=1 Tax=Streptomyces sp. NPDC059096 TaxID=3346727 RepID=UPI0036B504D5
MAFTRGRARRPTGHRFRRPVRAHINRPGSGTDHELTERLTAQVPDGDAVLDVPPTRLRAASTT